MKQGMMMYRWINIIDSECDPVCKVCIRVDSKRNIEKRLSRLKETLQNIVKDCSRMAEVDPAGQRIDKLNEIDQRIVDAIYNGFGISDKKALSPLFEKHRPTEALPNGVFYESVITLLLSGMKAAIDGRKQSVTVQVFNNF